MDGFTIGVDEKTHEKYLDYTGEWGEPMDSLFAAITDISVQAQNPQ
jgi:hypothetical protein